MYFNKLTLLSALVTFGLVQAQQFSGEATYYATGLGACGITNRDSDFIAALNWGQFDANQRQDCNRRIRVFYQGKSVDVTVTDRCAGCKWGDVDLSPGAFDVLAPRSAGRIHVTWQYI